MNILLVDNYDSFTYNLLHYFAELGATVEVKRNDDVNIDKVLFEKPRAIVISPGPGTPDDAGVCLELIRRTAGIIPLLGVCLGHQAIGQVYGGSVIRAPQPMHGKTSAIKHTHKGVFKGIPDPFTATRYHSLIVERLGLPECLEITAETEDKLIMGLMHKQHNVQGVQFHPESIASEFGHKLLGNFLSSV